MDERGLVPYGKKDNDKVIVQLIQTKSRVYTNFNHIRCSCLEGLRPRAMKLRLLSILKVARR
jgi:hypothetical protein